MPKQTLAQLEKRIEKLQLRVAYAKMKRSPAQQEAGRKLSEASKAASAEYAKLPESEKSRAAWRAMLKKHVKRT